MDTNPGESTTQASEAKDVEVQVEEAAVEKSRDRAAGWLTFLALLADIVAWLILVMMLAIGVYTSWQVIQNMRGAPVDQFILSLASSGLYTILMGLFYFIVLQAIAKGINVLLDIRDQTSALVEEE